MGQMKWLDVQGEEFKILHLRRNENEFWLPYHCFPNLVEPDRVVMGTRPSKGYRTMQSLLKKGWKYA